MQLSLEAVQPLIAAALQEDIGSGDITSNAVIADGMSARFSFVAREPMVVSGLILLPLLFSMIDNAVSVHIEAEEGEEVAENAVLATIEGDAKALLAGERTALNLIQRLSGIAAITSQYVEAIEGTNARIVDTRKTIAAHRMLDKYAVTCGGGQNHRMGLYDGVLIKDNHIAIAGSITLAVERARAVTPLLTKIEVECDTLAQVREAIAARADMILLDNMSLEQIKEAVALTRIANIATEASGNVSLSTVRNIAQTGVDYISVGKLTHSAPAVDIGLDAA